MLNFLFGSKRKSGKPGKSVNQMRGRKGQSTADVSGVIRRPSRQTREEEAEKRIKVLRNRNRTVADAKAAFAAAEHVPRPDIAGAIKAAQFEVKGQLKAGRGQKLDSQQKAVIDRALRLKASATTIHEALEHPAWRYVAMAVIRGHLEDKPRKGTS